MRVGRCTPQVTLGEGLLLTVPYPAGADLAYSLIVRPGYGEVCFLLTGVIETEVEERLAELPGSRGGFSRSTNPRGEGSPPSPAGTQAERQPSIFR